MSDVNTAKVSLEETDLRLDRWFKRHYPSLPNNQLQKLLRKGQVRLDGRRTKASIRLKAGQSIRIPPFSREEKKIKFEKLSKTFEASETEISAFKDSILHIDDELIVIDKKPGLPVQGGTGVKNNVDFMLDALKFDKKERPRLVHRLDKDTSGVLLIGRSLSAAIKLTEAFRKKNAQKIYWAIVVGSPKLASGVIDQSLSKIPAKKGDRVVPDPINGKQAITHYRVIERASYKASWLSLEPLTGRTHQLRVHMAALGTPILGDGKYGGPSSFLRGSGLSQKMHLHARAIRVPHPEGGELEFFAPLPSHMLATMNFFGFDMSNNTDTFIDSCIK